MRAHAMKFIVRGFALCVRVHALIINNIFVGAKYYQMNLNSNFIKIRAFFPEILFSLVRAEAKALDQR